MYKTVITILVSVLIVGCASANKISVEDQRWLNASQHMLQIGDKYISTTNSIRVKLLADWAKKNGHSFSVSHKDITGNEKPEMYFMIID